MVKINLPLVGMAVLVWALILAGGSMLLASCEDQSGGYPTPQLRSAEK